MSNDRLWAPWRIDYIRGLSPETDGGAASPGDACFLCCGESPLDDDERERRHILAADERGLLLLNRYPYTNGHLLAAPHAHVAELSDLDAPARAGLMELAELAHRLLKTTCHAQGVNMGLNLGRCAGAGLPGHLHMHIVPRWHGDVNFMEVVGGARVMPQSLDETFRQLRDAYARMA